MWWQPTEPRAREAADVIDRNASRALAPLELGIRPPTPTLIDAAAEVLPRGGGHIQIAAVRIGQCQRECSLRDAAVRCTLQSVEQVERKVLKRVDAGNEAARAIAKMIEPDQGVGTILVAAVARVATRVDHYAGLLARPCTP